MTGDFDPSDHRWSASADRAAWSVRLCRAGFGKRDCASVFESALGRSSSLGCPPMSAAGVQAFVACTSRKRHLPVPGLQLRDLNGPLMQRAAEWTSRLESARRTIAALDLYTGNSWFVARDLRDTLGNDCLLWALSAGFGLLGADDDIAPYGATLARGHADSVVRRTDPGGASRATRTWWGALCDWHGPSSQTSCHRKIASVAAKHPADLFVVCAGRSYVDAMADDLARAASRLAVPERLIIFGSGVCPDDRLRRSWVRVHSRVRLAVGGALNSLFVRIARYALVERDSSPADAFGMQAMVDQLAASVERPSDIRRDRSSDEQIADWIAGELQSGERISKSAALRKLRRGGRACEQSRFGRLFDDVQASLR